jgi:hypothetical protein
LGHPQSEVCVLTLRSQFGIDRADLLNLILCEIQWAEHLVRLICLRRRGIGRVLLWLRNLRLDRAAQNNEHRGGDNEIEQSVWG